MTFKDDNLRRMQAPESRAMADLLPIKRDKWDATGQREVGVIRYFPETKQLAVYEGVNVADVKALLETIPRPVELRDLEQLIEDGWMVD